jgi:serpin B
MARALSLPGPNWPQPRLHKAYAKLLRQLEPGEEAGYQLHIANALWAQKGYRFLDEFLTLNQESYGAGVRRVDFKGATEAARRTINAWVEKQTRDKIKELLKRGILTSLTRLVLTNAIYFKGDWASQFDKKHTRDMPFRLSQGQSVRVPMMYQAHKFGYMEAPDFQMLEMPYKGDDLSMVVLLPRKVGGLEAMCGKLKADELGARLSRIGRRRQKVRTWLPRFKLTSQFSLNQMLSSMGMVDAFTPGKADLSGMDGRKELYIQAVVHKAFVDVNEEGTEAAAATAVVVGLRSARPRILVFRADHPFLFLIRHNKTGTILFLGRVTNPKA